MKLTTEHLSYEHGFVSIIVPDGDDIPCGKILDNGADTCIWPVALGDEEPYWFSDEVADLVNQLMDHQYYFGKQCRAYQAQITADYLRGKEAK